MARTVKKTPTKATKTAPRKHIVHAIEDERLNQKKGRIELKIRWEGFKRASWESRETWTKEHPKMVKNFDAARKKKAGALPRHHSALHASTTCPSTKKAIGRKQNTPTVAGALRGKVSCKSGSRAMKRAADAKMPASSSTKKAKKALDEKKKKKVNNTATSMATTTRSKPVYRPSSNVMAATRPKPTVRRLGGQERESTEKSVIGQPDKTSTSIGNALVPSSSSVSGPTEASNTSTLHQGGPGDHGGADEDAEETIVAVNDQAVSTCDATTSNNKSRPQAEPSILKRRGGQPATSVRNVHFHPAVNFAAASESRALLPRQQGAVRITPTTSFAATMGRTYGEWKQKLDAISALCSANGYSNMAQGWTVDRAEEWMRILLSESCSFSEAASATANQLAAQKRGGR